VTIEKRVRIDKLLSSLGYGSRSEIASFISKGRVRVDGVDAESVSDRVLPSTVTLDGEALDPGVGMVILFHKPCGYVCSHDSSDGRLIYELLPERWTRRRPVVTSVGRLDADTSGLLILTDNGQIVHRLTSPKYKIEKVYEVTLENELSGNEAEIFASGTLLLQDETKPLLPAKLEVVSEKQATLILMEGRYHQVKRMFESVGNRVVKLHRPRLGPFTLDGLEVGAYRHLLGEEISRFLLG